MNIDNYVWDIEAQLEKNLYIHVAKQIQYNKEKIPRMPFAPVRCYVPSGFLKTGLKGTERKYELGLWMENGSGLPYS